VRNSIVIFIVCSLLFCQKQENISNPNLKDPNIALMLSLLPLLNTADPSELVYIPSFGQLYNEKPFKAFILSALKSYWLIDYEKSKKNNKIKDRNRSLWWLFGLILYGSIDAYVDAHLDKFPDKKVFKKNINEKQGE
tara:strand:+ start:189 stop:599 length:411 start_codon:yes stop_codon:yes gene_type:complete